MTRKPRPLKAGGTLGLIAPSETYKRERLQAGMERLNDIGFRTIVGKAAYSRYGFMAGKDEHRGFDINDMFANPEIDCIMSIAGGVAANRVIPYIDFKAIKSNPKPFVGFSDITVLLNAIYARTDLITFHGPMALDKIEGQTLEYFRKATMAPEPWSMPKEWKVLKKGSMEGRIVGGNLASVQSLLGTEYCPDWKGKIFFWEELLEHPTTIAALLMHFKLAGALDKINGMVIGKLKECGPARIKNCSANMNKIILELTEGYEFPIIYDFSSGHFARNITLPIGAKASIDTGKKRFDIMESAVEY